MIKLLKKRKELNELNKQINYLKTEIEAMNKKRNFQVSANNSLRKLVKDEKLKLETLKKEIIKAQVELVGIAIKKHILKKID